MNENVVLDLIKYIEDNLHENLKVDSLSKIFHYDRVYLSKSFKKFTGLSINEYINERKIIKSIPSVVNTDEKMLKIALESGYNSLEYFSETFYRVTSFSPVSLRANEKIKEILPFDIYNNWLENLKNNHEKILKIRTLERPKVKTIGRYK